MTTMSQPGQCQTPSNSAHSSSGLAMVRIHLHRVAVELRPKLGCPTGHFPQKRRSASRSSLHTPTPRISCKQVAWCRCPRKIPPAQNISRLSSQWPRPWGKTRVTTFAGSKNENSRLHDSMFGFSLHFAAQGHHTIWNTQGFHGRGKDNAMPSAVCITTIPNVGSIGDRLVP